MKIYSYLRNTRLYGERCHLLVLFGGLVLIAFGFGSWRLLVEFDRIK